ncbi:hypothetical protein ZIOFF_021948 [Zingiber officinale]|uniref:Uncharacterized protein n=1 Tax=Zingiber officinale TaxID=94328 RepID=A0A8J5H247_ZINOF|nr:hypothetical protein ZIOFF_021948 [Zingiber officinale]
MLTIGDFYRNIQISILTRGFERWQNGEANILTTRGLVGRLSNTPNIGFACEVQDVIDYLTSHGVRALPKRRYSTSSLQGLDWIIKPSQLLIPMQLVEVNSRNLINGRISVSFSNYKAASSSKPLKYNDKDEEIQSDEDIVQTLAVLIERDNNVLEEVGIPANPEIEETNHP